MSEKASAPTRGWKNPGSGERRKSASHANSPLFTTTASTPAATPRTAKSGSWPAGTPVSP